jgi:CubicO group peptidase (beta-lactamase class C family)
MNHSGYAFEGVPEAARANGYERDGEQWKLQPIAVHGEFGAMGGVYVTPEDYAKWLAFLLSAWPARDGPETGPARRSSVRELAQGLNFVGGRKRVGGPENDQCVWATAYGMGMTAARDCDLGLLLSHGGGYPGYGSFVALAPERGAAVFAFANRTYAGPAEPVWKSLFALDRAGMIPARPFKASARLEQMQAAARAAYAAGNFEPLAGMIGSNLPLDRSLEDRTAELVRLKAQLGDCPTAEPMFASGESTTVFRWNCARGKLDGRMSLAPLGPPQLQVLDFFPQPDK